jgi:transposase-like protein
MKKRKKAAHPAPERARAGRGYPLAVKLEAARLVLGEGLSQKAAALRLKVTQVCVCRWVAKFRSGRLAEEALDCHLPTVPVSELDAQMRALQGVQAAWREVFKSSDR